ncbi:MULTISPECIES: hypothetical protein [Alteromonas]|uniref:hypothetical protein n=1 Tax=Alteromonas TaxID=226 RepID=UPI0018D227EA|nr:MULTISPECIES: hypothetical protein [Alteromonas]
MPVLFSHGRIPSSKVNVKKLLRQFESQYPGATLHVINEGTADWSKKYQRLKQRRALVRQARRAMLPLLVR